MYKWSDCPVRICSIKNMLHRVQTLQILLLIQCYNHVMTSPVLEALENIAHQNLGPLPDELIEEVVNMAPSLACYGSRYPDLRQIFILWNLPKTNHSFQCNARVADIQHLLKQLLLNKRLYLNKRLLISKRSQVNRFKLRKVLDQSRRD